MSAEEIAEYESQLASINELLAATPEDESLLTLKGELTELLELTKGGGETAAADATPQEEQAVSGVAAKQETQDEDPALPSASIGGWETAATSSAALAAATSIATSTATAPASSSESPATATTSAAAAPKEKKKLKKLKDFVVPPHLITKETDSEAEKKKKRRALKALKSQHRQKKKEFEHAQKQKSWQSFQKKKNSSSSSSIFATQDDAHSGSKVGVVSKRTHTQFGQRTRHK